MEDQIIITGRLQSKSGVLKHPKLFEDVPLVILHVRNAYMSGLKHFANTHDIRELEITIKERSKDPTERAWKFFFALRDNLAVHTEGERTGKEYKDHLYRSCVRELQIRKDGKIVDSLKDLDKREMWLVTEIMLQWCVEAECDIRDILPLQPERA